MKLNIKNNITAKQVIYSLSALAALSLLSACDDNKNDKNMDPVITPMTYRYEVMVTNLTYAQPMSPVAVVLHNEGKLWQVGEAASVALETMAESGDNSSLLTTSVALSSASGEGVIMPSMNEAVMVSLAETMPMYLSVATMLVNTNDAFSGLNAIDISMMMVDQTMTYTVGTYDAGTEKNSEMMGTIPGPADGGEGFNASRDDVDFVAMHPGVVSSDDGLTGSVLTQAHKFDNPTLMISIKRVE
ncbi:MAG: spondin domain-containing protein [Thalassotalea sp.]